RRSRRRPPRHPGRPTPVRRRPVRRPRRATTTATTTARRTGPSSTFPRSQAARPRTRRHRAMRVERTFRAMGTEVHVVLVDGAASLLDRAYERIDELERRWSRFDADSEISTLNREAGHPVRVSPETRELVQRALEAWHVTGGVYDPTVLGDLLRA